MSDNQSKLRRLRSRINDLTTQLNRTINQLNRLRGLRSSRLRSVDAGPPHIAELAPQNLFFDADAHEGPLVDLNSEAAMLATIQDLQEDIREVNREINRIKKIMGDPPDPPPRTKKPQDPRGGGGAAGSSAVNLLPSLTFSY